MLIIPCMLLEGISMCCDGALNLTDLVAPARPAAASSPASGPSVVLAATANLGSGVGRESAVFRPTKLVQAPPVRQAAELAGGSVIWLAVSHCAAAGGARAGGGRGVDTSPN